MWDLYFSRKAEFVFLISNRISLFWNYLGKLVCCLPVSLFPKVAFWFLPMHDWYFSLCGICISPCVGYVFLYL